MNQKSGYAFRVVLGGWLFYLGCSLLYQMYKEQPSNMVLISTIAVVFVVIGGVCVIHSLKKIYDIRKAELYGPEAEEAQPDVNAGDSVPRDNKVQPVVLEHVEDEPVKEAAEDAAAEEKPLEEPSDEEQSAEVQAEETGQTAELETEGDEPDDGQEREEAGSVEGTDGEEPEDPVKTEETASKEETREVEETSGENEADETEEAVSDSRTDEQVPEAASDQTPEEEEPDEGTSYRNVEILEINEEETDTYADEIENDENDYEEK